MKKMIIIAAAITIAISAKATTVAEFCDHVVEMAKVEMELIDGTMMPKATNELAIAEGLRSVAHKATKAADNDVTKAAAKAAEAIATSNLTAKTSAVANLEAKKVKVQAEKSRYENLATLYKNNLPFFDANDMGDVVVEEWKSGDPLYAEAGWFASKERKQYVEIVNNTTALGVMDLIKKGDNKNAVLVTLRMMHQKFAD